MPEKKIVSKSVARRLAIQKEAKSISEDEMMLRKMIWLNHGCGMTHLYGDDGEMQCAMCLIDFKRDTVVSIHNTFEKISVAKMRKHLGGVEADIRTIGLQHRAENAKKD